MHTDTLLLGRADIARLLPVPACFDAVEAAFRRHGERSVPAPSILGVHVAGGGFHIKAALYPGAGGRPCFVAKTNANFPGNPVAARLPTIQGVILVFDAEDGRVLAVMDSIEITNLRTGAASAVAARYLAREDSAVMTIAGCGVQGRSQLRALASSCRLERAWVWDIDASASAALAADLRMEPGMPTIAVASSLRDATLSSDIVITCTPSREALLESSDVRPGTFIAAAGADSERKSEISPALLASSTVVVDVLEQCATIGDLHHALESGAMTSAAVYAELGEIVAGTKAGRRRDSEIIVFDSTGMALQDAACAMMAHERAMEAGIGGSFQFANR